MKNKIITAKVPWVFWIDASIRTGWFSFFWSTRGSNFKEFQIWIFRISFGMPWTSKDMFYDDSYYDEHTYRVNNDNLKRKFSILVKR